MPPKSLAPQRENPIDRLQETFQTRPPFDPYQTDPKRDPELVVQAAKPFNAETPLRVLAEQETERFRALGF